MFNQCLKTFGTGMLGMMCHYYSMGFVPSFLNMGDGVPHHEATCYVCSSSN
jgi:hypothetical protein